VENIPGPLLDRMEVIRLVGYITDEKTHIARGYLEKAAREGSGVKEEQVLRSSLYIGSFVNNR
jgi:ATP-dependent Lon protease